MQGKVYGIRGRGSLPSEKVAPLFYRQGRAAALLGMSLQDFLDRKALLLRQVEEVNKTVRETKKAVDRIKEAMREALSEGKQGGKRDAKMQNL